LAAADEQTAVFGDSGVNAATRQLLLEIVAMLELDAPVLRSRFGAPEVESAMEAAQTLAEFADFNSDSGGAINHSRDWYMAARVLRALLSVGPSAKVVYWAHNAHVTHPPGSNRTTGALLRGTLDVSTRGWLLLLAKELLSLKFLTTWKIALQCLLCHLDRMNPSNQF